ncbi:MAG TPA: holo-ACP synthase [Fimbriimonadales bacterium]|nr:holo-ACP synthase [Fimbriimonadales bacterium]
MIRGIGIDVVEVKRIENTMRNPRFTKRILTEREISSFLNKSIPPIKQAELSGNDSKSPPSFTGAELKPSFVAGRWAAKEAIAKAINKKLRWHDVEILADETGQPVVHLTDKAASIGGAIKISISHERGIAAAIAIWEE